MSTIWCLIRFISFLYKYDKLMLKINNVAMVPKVNKDPYTQFALNRAYGVQGMFRAEGDCFTKKRNLLSVKRDNNVHNLKK